MVHGPSLHLGFEIMELRSFSYLKYYANRIGAPDCQALTDLVTDESLSSVLDLDQVKNLDLDLDQRLSTREKTRWRLHTSIALQKKKVLGPTGVPVLTIPTDLGHVIKEQYFIDKLNKGLPGNAIQAAFEQCHTFIPDPPNWKTMNCLTALDKDKTRCPYERKLLFTLEAFCGKVYKRHERDSTTRFIYFVFGPPAAGKSTITDTVKEVHKTHFKTAETIKQREDADLKVVDGDDVRLTIDVYIFVLFLFYTFGGTTPQTYVSQVYQAF